MSSSSDLYFNKRKQEQLYSCTYSIAAADKVYGREGEVTEASLLAQ